MSKAKSGVFILVPHIAALMRAICFRNLLGMRSVLHRLDNGWSTHPARQQSTCLLGAVTKKFPKRMRHRWPHTFHRIALVWSNPNDPNDVWGWTQA